jgi:hypothetical protein
LVWIDGVRGETVAEMLFDEASVHRRLQPLTEDSLIRKLLGKRRVRRDEQSAEIGGDEWPADLSRVRKQLGVVAAY